MVSHFEDAEKVPRGHCNIGPMLAQQRSNLEICSLNSGQKGNHIWPNMLAQGWHKLLTISDQ